MLPVSFRARRGLPFLLRKLGYLLFHKLRQCHSLDCGLRGEIGRSADFQDFESTVWEGCRCVLGPRLDRTSTVQPDRHQGPLPPPYSNSRSGPEGRRNVRKVTILTGSVFHFGTEKVNPESAHGSAKKCTERMKNAVQKSAPKDIF